MGSHLLGLANSSQLQGSKNFKMKLPLILAATVAVGLAGPQYLRSYGVGANLRGQFGNYGGQSFRRNLISQGSNFGSQGNYLGYANSGQLKTYSNYQNYLSKTPVPFSEPARVDDIIPPAQTGNYIGKQLDQVAILPAAASGLAYMRNYFGKDDLCGESGLAYMETILSGGSGVQAQANAEAAYKAAWARGARILPGSACAASEVAFKEAYASGNADATLESALAFVNNWPGLKDGNPCAVSGKAYMDAILAGNSVDSAGLISGKAFIVAFGDAARAGKNINDPACAASAKAFIDAANPPYSASAESAKAFIDATLTTSSSGYDPVCAASALAYMDAFASGKDPLTSNLIAAKAFFLEYTKGTTPGVDSPCVKATLAYASRSPSPSPANRDAMVAFINQAVNDREAFFDPVCGAATIAFLDAKIAGKTDKEAGADSAEAYIEAFAANGGRRTEACKRSAEAYIKTF